MTPAPSNPTQRWHVIQGCGCKRCVEERKKERESAKLQGRKDANNQQAR